MSQIKGISLGTSLDLSGLSQGFSGASKQIDEFFWKNSSRLKNLPTGLQSLDLSVKQDSGGNDLASTAEEIGASFAPLGIQIRQALSSAAQPIARFASTFGAQFEQVGPVVEKLAIRIDSAMRFPAFLARVAAFRKGFLSRFEEIATEAPKKIQEAFHPREADAAQLVAPFAAARKKIQDAVKPIPNDVGYALEAAEHVDHRAAFPQFLAGLDGFKSAALDKLKAVAAAAAMPAKGKGSRKALWARRDAAADIASAHAAVPPRDNTTRATVVRTSAWEKLGRAIITAGEIEERTQAKIAQLVARDARDIDRLIGAWLGFKKVTGVISTFGSVAGATFAKVSGFKPPKFTLDSSQSQVIKGIGSAAEKTTGHLKGMASQAALALGVFGLTYKAVDFLKTGIKSASDLNETVSKTRVIMGGASPAVEKFANEMASKFGLVKGVTLDTAASFGGLAKSLGGLRGENLSGFSTQFTKLAADLSSFSNIDMKSAGDAIRIGLSGNQSDKLKELGVLIDEQSVKQYALRHGLASTNGELSEQAKFMARAGLITEGLSAASGDLERTQDGAANQSRKLWGTIENLGASIGGALLPAVTAGVSILNEFATVSSGAFEAGKESVAGWGETIIDWFDMTAAVVMNLPAAFEVARLGIYEKLVNIGEYVAVLGPNFMIVAEYIGKNWTSLLVDAFNGTIVGLKNLWKNFQAIGTAIGQWFADPRKGFHVDWTPLLNEFKATADQFPELLKPALTDMSAEIAKAAQPIVDDYTKRRNKRAEAKKAVNPEDQRKDLRGGPEAKDKARKTARREESKPFELKFAGADELGTKEGYSAIARSLGGRTSGMDQVIQVNRKTADNTGQAVKELVGLRRELVGAKKKPAPMEIP